jgi:hypothetical protein
MRGVLGIRRVPERGIEFHQKRHFGICRFDQLEDEGNGTLCVESYSQERHIGEI